jgi:hypothetical protein
VLVRFALTGRATVAAGGTATVTVNGPPAWWRYDISTVVISSSPPSAGVYPQASVYRGAITQSTLLGQSRSADKVTFEGAPGDTLLPGDALIVVMSQCLVGSTVVVNVYGEQVPIS